MFGPRQHQVIVVAAVAGPVVRRAKDAPVITTHPAFAARAKKLFHNASSLSSSSGSPPGPHTVHSIQYTVRTATKTFGQRVRSRRHELELSQEALAANAGLRWTFVGQVERGRRYLTLHNILKLAAALKIDSRRPRPRPQTTERLMASGIIREPKLLIVTNVTEAEVRPLRDPVPGADFPVTSDARSPSGSDGSRAYSR